MPTTISEMLYYLYAYVFVRKFIEIQFIFQIDDKLPHGL